MKIENVWYQLDWAKFRRGYSFFVPCIDVLEAKAEIERITDRLEIKIVTKVAIEHGVKGLRVWRI